SFRYFAVELLTALLFLAMWQRFPWQLGIAYWIFVSFLIIGTFIDFEHFIIPDRVTIGGTIAGVACSIVVPALMQTNSRVAADARRSNTYFRCYARAGHPARGNGAR